MIYAIAQNDAIQQRESAHHQPEDTGQEQEQQSQDNFHVDQADERYQGWNMDGMLHPDEVVQSVVNSYPCIHT